jgi:hypothetical protein
MFEGYSYPTVRAMLAGGMEGRGDDELLAGMAEHPGAPSSSPLVPHSAWLCGK